MIWRTIMPKKFSHYHEGSELRLKLPRLGIWQRDWESPGNLTLKGRGIWLQGFHRTGGGRDSTFGGHKKNLVCTKTQGKGVSVTLQETEPDLPARVGMSPTLAHTTHTYTHTHTHTHTHRVDVWVRSHSLWGRRHWQQQSWKGPLAWALLEVTINPIIELIHPRVGSPLVKKLHSSVDSWIAVLVSIALLTRARPNFPHH